MRVIIGLPQGWRDGGLGNPPIPGEVQYDGKLLTVDAAGAALMSPSDEGHFVAATPDCVALTARFVPQTASQFVMFGLACRRGFDPVAPCAALLVAPAAGRMERRGWYMRLMIRNQNGGVEVVAGIPMGQSAGTYGRLMNPVWFRMQRREGAILAQFSFDGVDWRSAGEVPEVVGGTLGFAVSSGIPAVDSAVRFDSLTASTR